MNNKIIIKVYVPQISNSFDVFIPINLTISDITKLISETITEISNREFIPSNELRLYMKENGEILDYKNIVKDTSLKNGSKVVLL